MWLVVIKDYLLMHRERNIKLNNYIVFCYFYILKK
jgi:hypothetical protein